MSDTSIWPLEDPSDDTIKPLKKRQEDKKYSYGAPEEGDDVIIPCPWTLTFDV